VLHEKFLQISPSVLPYFYWGSKSGQILPQFSTPLAFQVLWFQNGGICRNSEKWTGCTDDWPKQGQDISPIPPQFYRGVKTNFAQFYYANGATDQKSNTFLDNYYVWPITLPSAVKVGPPICKIHEGDCPPSKKMVDLNWAYCPPVKQTSSQRHFRGFALGHAWNISLRLLAHLSPNSRSCKKCEKLDVNFSQNSHLSHPHFESEQNVKNLKPASEILVTILWSLKIWCRSIYPTLRLQI